MLHKAKTLIRRLHHCYVLSAGVFTFLKLSYAFVFAALPYFVSRHVRSQQLKVCLSYRNKKIPITIRVQDINILLEMFADETYSKACDDVMMLPDECIVDLGSHIGLSAIFFAVHFPNTSIHAYEPTQESFGLLSKNIELFPKITAYKKAVAEKSGTVTLHINEHFQASNTAVDVDYGGEDQECIALSLDEIISATGAPIALLKFDIEDIEVPVFRASNKKLELPRIFGEFKVRDENELTIFENMFSDTHEFNVFDYVGKVKFVQAIKQ